MIQFGSLYSQYYDLLYSDKDYEGEVDYVNTLLKENSNNAKTLLDMGCGTGAHAEIFCDKGYKVSLETSVAFDIADVDPRVKRVVDLKTPSSQELDKNRYENIPLLVSQDEVKFVICNREDFIWSVEIIDQYQLYDRVNNLGLIIFCNQKRKYL